MDFLTFVFIYVLCSLALILLVGVICFKNWWFHRTVEKLNQHGLELFNNGRLDEAIATFRKAVAMNSYSALSHSNLGYALCCREDALFEALDEYGTAIKIEPLNAEHYIRRAELYLNKMRDPVQSQLDLQRAREIVPPNVATKSANGIVSKSSIVLRQVGRVYDTTQKHSPELRRKKPCQTK